MANKILELLTESPANIIRYQLYEEKFIFNKEAARKFVEKYESLNPLLTAFYDLVYGTYKGVNTKYKALKDLLGD
jgi:hypothetical protein